MKIIVQKKGGKIVIIKKILRYVSREKYRDISMHRLGLSFYFNAIVITYYVDDCSEGRCCNLRWQSLELVILQLTKSYNLLLWHLLVIVISD